MAKKNTEEQLPTISRKVFKNLARVIVSKKNDLEIIDFFLSIGSKILSTHENQLNQVVIYVQKPEKAE